MTAPGSQFPRWLPAQIDRPCVVQLSSSELSQSPTAARQANISDTTSSSRSVTTTVQRFVASSSDSCSIESISVQPPPPPPPPLPPRQSAPAPSGTVCLHSSSECIALAYQMSPVANLRQTEFPDGKGPERQPQQWRPAGIIPPAHHHSSRHVITEFEKNLTNSTESSTEQQNQLVMKFGCAPEFANRNAGIRGSTITRSGGGDTDSHNPRGVLKPRITSLNNSRSFPAWSGLPEDSGNVSNNPTPSTAEQPEQQKQPEARGQQTSNQQQAPDKKPGATNPNDEPQKSCWAECSVLRCIGLCLYYLAVWAVAAGFAWLLLEVTLRVTSQGRFPYYMGPHSFCMSGAGLGYPGGNPELGKVAKFGNLTDLADKLTDQIGKIYDAGSKGSERPYRKCEGPETTETAELMKPCNLSAFAKAAKKLVKDLLTKTPAAFLQMKRHLGYLPASGKAVKIKCTVSNEDKNLPLAYYSWWGAPPMNKTSDFGSIPTMYFPMLSRLHNVPGVLVAVKEDTEKKDWLGKKLTFKCRPSDGSKGEGPMRELIIKIGS